MTLTHVRLVKTSRQCLKPVDNRGTRQWWEGCREPGPPAYTLMPPTRARRGPLLNKQVDPVLRQTGCHV